MDLTDLLETKHHEKKPVASIFEALQRDHERTRRTHPILNEVAFEHEWYSALYTLADDPKYIWCYRDTKNLLDDNYTKTRLGRFIEHILGIEHEKALKLTNVVRSGKEFNEFQVATDREEIKRIYLNGPHSCMSYNFDLEHHPVEAYASGDFGVAYLENFAGEIKARAVVNLENETFARVYGNEYLRELLTKNGFSEDSDFASGCRLLRLPQAKSFIAPYIDGCDNDIFDDGEYLWIDRPEKGNCVGHAHSSYDNHGLLERNLTECEYCGVNYHPEDLHYINESDVCDSCIEEHFVFTEDAGYQLHENCYETECGDWFYLMHNANRAGYFQIDGYDDLIHQDYLVHTADGDLAHKDDVFEFKGEYYPDDEAITDRDGNQIPGRYAYENSAGEIVHERDLEPLEQAFKAT